jgi:hypothetical protein
MTKAAEPFEIPGQFCFIPYSLLPADLVAAISPAYFGGIIKNPQIEKSYDLVMSKDITMNSIDSLAPFAGQHSEVAAEFTEYFKNAFPKGSDKKISEASGKSIDIYFSRNDMGKDFTLRARLYYDGAGGCYSVRLIGGLKKEEDVIEASKPLSGAKGIEGLVKQLTKNKFRQDVIYCQSADRIREKDLAVGQDPYGPVDAFWDLMRSRLAEEGYSIEGMIFKEKHSFGLSQWNNLNSVDFGGQKLILTDPAWVNTHINLCYLNKLDSGIKELDEIDPHMNYHQLFGKYAVNQPLSIMLNAEMESGYDKASLIIASKIFNGFFRKLPGVFGFKDADGHKADALRTKK